MTNESKCPKFSAEVRERAVRMVFEHRTEDASQWAAIVSIAKVGTVQSFDIQHVRKASTPLHKEAGCAVTSF